MVICVLSRALRGSHDEHEIPGWLFYTGGSTTLINIGIMLEIMISHAKRGFSEPRNILQIANGRKSSWIRT